MKKFFKEFKEFALRGNMVDLAVGMIIGAAFTAVVTSLVNDIFMPILGLLTWGYVDFTKIVIHVRNVDVTIGNFIAAVVNFIAIAFVVFLIVKGINKMRAKKEAEEPKPATRICPYCRSEIAKEACRCPHCTSELEPEPEPEPESEEAAS